MKLFEDALLYVYGKGTEDEEPISTNTIRRVVTEFIDNTTIKEFSQLIHDYGYTAEVGLMTVLYDYCITLGTVSQYHPYTYLDSMDEEDLQALTRRVKQSLWV